MGAQPKNKITRAERGKRRAGNTPSLKKDAKRAKTPLHKQTLMKKFAQASSTAATTPKESDTPKKAAAQPKPAKTKKTK